MHRILGLLVSVSVAASAQTIHFSAVSQPVVEQRLGAYVKKNNQREPAVRQLFEDAGCGGDKLTEQPVKGLKAPNLICTLAGETESVIVVGAHFDLVEEGDGVVDNWTGASLLSSLYQGLADAPRRHTFRFVSFSGEEKGLVGSKAYVQQIVKTHEPVIAMVNMDTLGLAETEVWLSHADANLVRLMEVAAATVKLPVSAVNVDQVGNSKDRIEAVHIDEYYRTYRLVLAYLAVLDRRLE
jgi:hypothetical protein